MTDAGFTGTPGPWRVDASWGRGPHGHIWIVHDFAGRKEHVASISTHEMHNESEECWRWGRAELVSTTRYVKRQCAEADARAIAALPDLIDEGAFLLDRLAQFASCVETDESYREWAGHVEPAIARFRAALSKATVKPGGAPQADASVPPPSPTGDEDEGE